MRQPAVKTAILKDEFKAALWPVLNSHGVGAGHLIPDTIIAEYLWECLQSFERSKETREAFFYMLEAKLTYLEGVK